MKNLINKLLGKKEEKSEGAMVQTKEKFNKIYEKHREFFNQYDKKNGEFYFSYDQKGELGEYERAENLHKKTIPLYAKALEIYVKEYVKDIDKIRKEKVFDYSFVLGYHIRNIKKERSSIDKHSFEFCEMMFRYLSKYHFLEDFHQKIGEMTFNEIRAKNQGTHNLDRLDYTLNNIQNRNFIEKENLKKFGIKYAQKILCDGKCNLQTFFGFSQYWKKNALIPFTPAFQEAKEILKNYSVDFNSTDIKISLIRNNINEFEKLEKEIISTTHKNIKPMKKTGEEIDILEDNSSSLEEECSLKQQEYSLKREVFLSKQKVYWEKIVQSFKNCDNDYQ